MKNLTDLMNIGPAMEKHLHAIGIYSEEGLRSIGPTVAYKKMKDSDIKVCRMMLYAMEGALCNRNAIEIAQMMKC